MILRHEVVPPFRVIATMRPLADYAFEIVGAGEQICASQAAPRIESRLAYVDRVAA